MGDSRIELNGRTPTLFELAALAQLNYGHFTSFQAEHGAVRGFRLHLKRLVDASRELFGTELDRERVRELVRHALGTANARVRITVFSLAFDRARAELPQPLDILVSVQPVRERSMQPLRVQSIVHGRCLPTVKHVGTFELFHLLRMARLAGFDDVLFCTESGDVAEGSVWNVGFWDGHRITWPNAPALHGITRQLLDEGLQEAGIETRTCAVNLRDLAAYRSAFALNALAIGPLLARIDGRQLDCDSALLERLQGIYQQIPLEPI